MAHSHSQHHRHAVVGGEGGGDMRMAFLLGIIINLVFASAEAVAGLITGSMALLADAGHNFSDVIGLAIAWAGAKLGQRRPSARFTYGLGGSSILAALANGLLLLGVAGGIAWEALQRLADPQPVSGATIMIVAGIAIAVNAGTAMLFVRGRDDLNVRGAFLHLAADAAISAAVVLGGLLILLTGAWWIDPAVSLAVVLLIFAATWGLLRDSIRMSLAGVPPGIDIGEVARALAAQPGVKSVHDLHIWPMSTSETALTAHLVMPAGHPGDDFLAGIQAMLDTRFGIGHATVQIELTQLAEDNDCEAPSIAGEAPR